MGSSPSFKLSARDRHLAKFWKLLQFTLFLIYPKVASHVLAFFVCRNVEGIWYIRTDFSNQ